MTIENFIKYTRWTGLFKKTRAEESGYDIMEWYEIRWYHPLCWIWFAIAFLCQIYILLLAMVQETFEEIEIHKRKK